MLFPQCLEADFFAFTADCGCAELGADAFAALGVDAFDLAALAAAPSVGAAKGCRGGVPALRGVDAERPLNWSLGAGSCAGPSRRMLAAGGAPEDGGSLGRDGLLGGVASASSGGATSPREG